MKKVNLGLRALDILNIGTALIFFINVFRFDSHMYISDSPRAYEKNQIIVIGSDILLLLLY